MKDPLKMPMPSQVWKINDSQVLCSTHKYRRGGNALSVKSYSNSYLCKNPDHRRFCRPDVHSPGVGFILYKRVLGKWGTGVKHEVQKAANFSFSWISLFIYCQFSEFCPFQKGQLT